MPSYRIAVVLTLLISSVFALPAPAPSSQRKGRSFKVDRVRNVNFGGHDGTAALIKAKRKWGMEVSPELVESHALARRHVVNGEAGTNAALLGALSLGAGQVQDVGFDAGDAGAKVLVTVTSTYTEAPQAAATNPPSSVTAAPGSTGGGGNEGETGEVTATPEESDVEFLSPVEIGGQTLNMDFDSGSSDLWVFNTQLPAAQQQGHTIYDPEKSKTFKSLKGSTFSISYGDGSGAAGNVGTDTVNIGGAIVNEQAIELATEVSQSFVQDTHSNGLVGLAFSSLNTVKPVQQKTFFDNVLDLLDVPVFTADLKDGKAGSYEFGAIDSAKFEGDLSWASVNASSGFWQFSSEQFSINNGDLLTEAGGQAIADTGTTLMLVNPAVVNAYYSTVNGAVNDASVGGITFPCSTDLPDLQVDIGGVYMANIPGSVINFAPTDATGKTCFGGVQATTSDLQIYGDILFKAQFVAFNAGNSSIGMAPHN